MASARKTSIHKQIMMRRASRSEYNDSLLRNNQRQENRLLLELDQWDKAQRTVAKGLEKESQWFKQTASTGQRPVPRKNSSTDLNSDGSQSRFIPDYQYRNRSSVVSQSGIAEEHDSEDQQDGPSANAREHDADHTDSSKSHKKHSKSSEGKKSSGSKHGDHKKSHRKSHRHGGERESRGDKESERRDSDKAKESGDSASSADKKTSKTAAEPSVTSSKPNHSPQSASDKTPPSKTSSKHSKKHATDDAAVTATTNTTTTTTTTTTTQSTAEDTKSGSASKSSARATSLHQNVHDPGDVIISPRQLNELGWDGRRRYTNVWDSLSSPKHASQVRSVRSRLQREFTQVPAARNNTGASRGLASARRPGHAPSLA